MKHICRFKPTDVLHVFRNSKLGLQTHSKVFTPKNVFSFRVSVSYLNVHQSVEELLVFVSAGDYDIPV